MKLSDKKDVSDKLVDSTVLLTAGGWAVQILGLLSTLVLARLLTPGDYGIVASATIFSAFFQIVSELGSLEYIRKKKVVTTSDIDNAWTIRIVQQGITSLIVAMLAPYAGQYFESSEVTIAVYSLAVINFVHALTNISYYIDIRELNYKTDITLKVIGKLASVITTVLVAFYYRNYLAFLFGLLAGGVVTVLLSYMILSYKPRLRLAGASKQWTFSQWLIFTNIATYLRNKVDQWYVGSVYGLADLGRYNMADTLASLSVSQVGWPAVSASTSALSGVNDNYSKLSFLTERIIGTLLYISVPIIVFMFYYWVPVVDVVLGSKWTDLHDYGYLFLFIILFMMLVTLNQNILIISGNERVNAAYTWGQAISLSAVLYVGIEFSLYYFIFAKMLTFIFFIVMYSFWTKKTLGIGIKVYLQRSYRVIMISLLSLAPGVMVEYPTGLLSLVFIGILYVTCFLLIITTLRHLKMFHCDIEEYIVTNAFDRLKRIYSLVGR